MTFCLITLVTTPGIHVVYIFSFIHVILKKTKKKKSWSCGYKKNRFKDSKMPTGKYRIQTPETYPLFLNS